MAKMLTSQPARSGIRREMSMARENGSGPVAQPALQMRSLRAPFCCAAMSSGKTWFCSMAKVSGLRKK